MEQARTVDSPQHILTTSVFVKVWVYLVILTAITVGASVLFPGAVGIGVATLVTPIKAALILLFFMHLKYESTALRTMFLVAISILAIFIGLTFFDYPLR